ncbi:peptide N-acetyl-beta-D-glucosaminyl asparaginase amidase A-domain-containing protein [Phakopsora pachyrhizi]|nr:peptide N-acetyl-beta-D-glucosaminyl asparaginase amidase A-domain-containing protein [Phakopsora pachyrhizi]
MNIFNCQIWFIFVNFSIYQLCEGKLQPRQYVNRPNALRNFEVREPPVVPHSKACEKILIQHTFEHSFGRPAIVDYSPPTECGPPGTWASVIFNLTTTGINRQYDRLGHLKLDGIEVWRTSTAEPTLNGIVYSVTRDMGNYVSLLKKSGIPLSLDIGNIIDPKLNITGIFEVTLSAKYYPAAPKFVPLNQNYQVQNIGFQLGSNLTQALNFPKNLASAYVQLFASGSGLEEYMNVPDDYYKILAPTGKEDVTGKGSFREVQLWIDNYLAGVVYPFPVVYTGGIILSWWRPIAGIGAFDAPAYTIDITPFVPLLADGAPHSFTIAVKGQGENGSINPDWIFSGMALFTVDPSGKQTTGKILNHVTDSKTLVTPPASKSHPVDGSTQFKVTSYRKLSVSSTVTTGSGSQVVKFEQDLTFSNTQNRATDQSSQTIVQSSTGTSSSNHGNKQVLFDKFDFPFNLKQDVISDSTTDTLEGGLDHGYKRIQEVPFNPNFAQISISTDQKSTGYLKFDKSGNIVDKIGRTSQMFDYSDSKKETYHREVEIYNVTQVIKDSSSGTLAPSKTLATKFLDEKVSGPLTMTQDNNDQPYWTTFCKLQLLISSSLRYLSYLKSLIIYSS